MKVLNLGCGNKTSSNENVINIDWSIYLRLKKMNWIEFALPTIIGETRMKRLKEIPDNILVHNLKHGIPFGNSSVDMVYHSHVLEHLDRNIAIEFLEENKRVLKKGGVLRIVVPDFESLNRSYMESIVKIDTTTDENALTLLREKHELHIASMIEQSVRRQSFSTANQIAPRKILENLFLGDARKRGETHQWMYDRITLVEKLEGLGFSQVNVVGFERSSVHEWNSFGLEYSENKSEYKPGSLYIEAIK